MSDAELIEYMFLADKAETEQLSNEQLSKLNEFHMAFLRELNELALQNHEEISELQISLGLIKESLDENDSLNTILCTFIEEKGLQDEFNEFFNEAINKVVQDLTSSKIVH